VPEPIGPLLPYLRATAFGGNQRVRRENDSLDRFLILLNFAREPEPGQQVGDGRVVHLHALGLGERIAQFKERDVGVLSDQLLKESLMCCQLPFAGRRSPGCGFGMPHGPNLMRPTRSCCR
jgi:hypothetical protein